MQSSKESVTHDEEKINNRNKPRSSRHAETGRQGP